MGTAAQADDPQRVGAAVVGRQLFDHCENDPAALLRQRRTRTAKAARRSIHAGLLNAVSPA
ncbi:MAG: hypothetical protein ACK5F7_24135, partial [Planctomycetaceae bacterium]